ncbi:DUF2489 domain-containing protein [Pasteurellaceae bacterium TAE3-ERU1]|uniref:DUF2489 domain-containing protein n=1 Tax=Spirabiliibacterium mucosae TaxID=28156 RepID=UPI001AAC8666|nr:DUF2489 domain-containing protein [Spirabiliibacterium mucosae]MBE2897326.1 DUF2489 domain-containing protein [Spirabiliibacterium mucosae]MBV7388657.1 DUF2489 domain-containing protein [Pasteurellaceae bacterium TAE3-ERU1]
MSTIQILLFVGIVIVVGLAGWAGSLMLAVNKQKQRINAVKLRQFDYAKESIEIIANAMLRDECNLSEGVIRINGLLANIGGMALRDYPAMFALYDTVKAMPILDERRALKRNERMRYDLTREAKEAELQAAILDDARQLLQDLQHRKLYV